MTDVAHRTKTPSTSPIEPLESRGPKPITYWAAIGAAFVLLNLWIYGRWFAAGDLSQTPHGPDEIPLKAWIGSIVFQVASICLAIAAVIVVTRQCLRERRLTFDAALLIAWVLSSWQDPFINYLRPQFFYNSVFFDVGSWAPYIPGWSSPLGGNLAEDVIGTAGVGYLWFVLVIMLGCAGLRAVKRRWPQVSQVGLFLIALVIVGLVDFLTEWICVRFLELWAYPGGIHALSLSGGTWHQFPIYETLFWGGVWAAITMLRYNLDDHGMSAVERGASELRARKGTVTVMRLLAITAFVNVVFLIYSVAMIVMNLLPGTDSPAGYPSYLREYICGAGTPYPCPARDVPIWLNGPVR